MTSKTPENLLRAAALAGIAFAVPMGVFLGWTTHSILGGLEAAVVSGTSFGFLIHRFASRMASGNDNEIAGQAVAFEAGENLVYAGLANHWKGLESVGGKLFLTNRRLRFRSHKMNVQNHDESYVLSDIILVKASRTLGIVPNGLKVHLRGGTVERFVVTNRSDWVQRLQPK
jgi:hypothetical protein